MLSARIVDSQIKGRKHHIVTDTQGLLIRAVVTSANGNDCKGIKRLLDKPKDGNYKCGLIQDTIATKRML